jgi:hypothetical protein
MKWITRERPKIDRIACPWLIRRFIDPEAEFLYVPRSEVLADIVRGADTDRFDLAPQAAGLWAISAGLSHNYRDDLEQLEAGMVVYDALYSWASFDQEERHNWNPNG